MNVRSFFAIAVQRNTVLRALKIALVVGLILVSVNEGSAIVRGEFDMVVVASAAMNFFVPYCVSTVSTVLAQAEADSKET